MTVRDVYTKTADFIRLYIEDEKELKIKKVIDCYNIYKNPEFADCEIVFIESNNRNGLDAHIKEEV